jgi:dipeptidyl aminopeptidase/acylaminoacyl peptidase
MKLSILLLGSLAIAAPLAAQTPDRRTLTVDDLFALKRVSDPQVSPDGRWVAYVVGTTTLKDEKSESRIWMMPLAGGDPIPMTTRGGSASSPRWSPDGKSLGFLVARQEGKTQVWTLNRQGGEAEQLTEVKQGVSGFEWSPDGGRLALLVRDMNPEERGDTSWIGRAAKTPEPWVMDRLQFKRDNSGYLNDERTHLYVFDLAGKQLRQLTEGAWDDGSPAWSPDGRSIAFVSNRDPVDGTYNSDIWIVGADDTTRGSSTRRLTTNGGQDGSPAWSPDGKWIAYTTQPSTEPVALIYDPSQLAIIAAEGGTPRLVTGSLDRDLSRPRWSPDGRRILAILEDSGDQHLVSVDPADGALTRLVAGTRTVSGYSLAPDGAPVVLVSEPHLPAELFGVRNSGLIRLTHVNQALVDSLRLGEVRDIQFKSRDGTAVEAFVYTPPDYVAGQRYPTLLRIHGGPVSQYDRGFNFEAQLFAANGYVVVMTNPRGSSGYGSKFARAIMADWGTRDFEDVMAAVDETIRLGYADADRLGVGGWSYGGILTNYVITKSTRFKGAVTGASEVLYTANYGHDHYQYLWEIEMGLPWKNQKEWDRISPFWSVEKIVTPTLIMGGEKDWNVPILNSEQLYQALKRLGRTTQLVVYPGQHHGIQKPSYQKDRLQRYLEWYDRYVKTASGNATSP